jgi:4-hydroxy-2-oxoheptanedioate aldolase
MNATPQSELADRLRARQQVLGLVIKMPNQALIEQAGHLGFDMVVIDTEHGFGDGEQLEHHLRAADSAGIPAIVRASHADSADCLRALDGGAAGLIFPHVDSAENATTAVHRSHYPPTGTRGFATSTRAGRQGTVPIAEHVDSARRNTIVIAQIETPAGVTNSQAIAATDHVDGVWLGPGDLSMTLGHPGDLKHPVVADAIEKIAQGVLAADKAALCVIANEPADVDYWSSRGASVFLFVAPTIIARAFRELLTETTANRTLPSHF